MGTWSEIGKEIRNTLNGQGVPDFDGVRRKYLQALADYTQRPVILYASRWIQGSPHGVPALAVSIADVDLQGFMETVHGLQGNSLDLIVHSPGGDPGAAEGIVKYLRSKFTDIRVIVPQVAMSAATMLACAANRVVMGKHSYLGPTDPQLILDGNSIPAQAVLDQFDLAQQDCADPKRIGAWMPILPRYAPAMLVQCKNAIQLAHDLVEEWLSSWMLNNGDQQNGAKDLAQWLADNRTFKVHNRHIGRDELRAKGMVIDSLEDDSDLQDLVLSVYHAATYTFSMKPVSKIIENHQGRSYVTGFGSSQTIGSKTKPQP